ncbi:MAG: hypothetical protein IJE18_08045 [Bacteroidaceae bacterium]|nr:hypothetical protein [Bacteroidaceae bacterium]
MNIEEVIHFSKYQWHEINRQLRYIDFAGRRSVEWPVSNDMYGLLQAVVSLSGVSCTAEQLQKVIAGTDVEGCDATIAQQCYRVIQMLLADEVDTTLDESRIVSIYNMLYSSDVVPNNCKERVTVASLLSGNKQQVAETKSVASDALNRCVELYWICSADGHIHPMVVAAVFLYEFRNTTTFVEGRDLVTILMMLLLLRRMGAEWVRLYSPLLVMNEDCVAYRRAIYGGANGTLGCSEWVKYWVDMIYEAARRAGRAIAPSLPPATASHKTVLNSRQRAVLDYIGRCQPVKLSDIVVHLHKESVNTIKKDLLHLRTLGYIVADGVQKGTVYYRV